MREKSKSFLNFDNVVGYFLKGLTEVQFERNVREGDFRRVPSGRFVATGEVADQLRVVAEKMRRTQIYKRGRVSTYWIRASSIVEALGKHLTPKRLNKNPKSLGSLLVKSGGAALFSEIMFSYFNRLSSRVRELSPKGGAWEKASVMLTDAGKEAVQNTGARVNLKTIKSVCDIDFHYDPNITSSRPGEYLVK